MSGAERSRRARLKARQAREAASHANGTLSPPAPSAPAVAPAQPLPVPGGCTARAAALVFLAGDAETIAARILDTVPVEMARDIAAALQRRLWMGSSPAWRPGTFS